VVDFENEIFHDLLMDSKSNLLSVTLATKPLLSSVSNVNFFLPLFVNFIFLDISNTMQR